MTMQFCQSRSAGRPCARELGHRGLHRHRTIMWADAGADGPRCPGSGSPGAPAPVLEGGFPGGRALCRECLGFVEVAHGHLIEHDSSDPSETEAETRRRRQWLNEHGW